jgi:hypothetical protein
MRYGYPAWLTSDNGPEFSGAFRHQLERFGIEHVTTSVQHPQSNGAAERLVRTFKTMLAAKVAGATHNWSALLPQLRMEYMQRRHATTGYSPNQLIFGREFRFSPPIGPLAAQNTSFAASNTPSNTVMQEPRIAKFAQQQNELMTQLAATAHQRILTAQRYHADRRNSRLAARGRRGRTLAVGDLAYLLTKGLKTQVQGPFLVCKLTDTQAVLRTTAAVQGQKSHEFSVHLDRVARCTTVTDVLQDLLKQAGYCTRDSADSKPTATPTSV